MTRAAGELLREVATALACFASTKHAQAHVQRNPAIKAEMLLEVDRIEALEREVRAAAQAQADAETGEIEALRQEHEALRLAVDASDGPIRRLRNRIYDLVSQLEARQQADLYTPVIRQQVDELRGRATQHRAALAQAQAGAGEGQGEGE